MKQGIDHSLTRADISFDSFPCGPCRVEIDRTLHALDGVNGAEFQDCVRRLSICFDSSKVSISHILTSLEAFSGNPHVVSVISPCFHGFNS